MRHIKHMQQRFLAMIPALLLALPAFGGEINGLTTFSAGTPAVAVEVNGNFTAITTAVNDNNARIATLEAKNAVLEAKIAALEAKLASVSVETVNGQPTVRFAGVNVQVVNGLGYTETANGTGNLLVGYDEEVTSSINRCTIGTNPSTGGTVVDASTCASAGGTWTSAGFKTGSHYLVTGRGNNYSRWGGVVFGYRNTSNYDYASVTGGQFNTASGTGSSVGGGSDNVAGGNSASVSGGAYNSTGGDYASVSGGEGNGAVGFAASVNGGWGNFADTDYSSILGGANLNTSTSMQTLP